MSLQRLVIDTELTADQFKSVCDLAPGQAAAAQNFINYIAALTAGLQSADLSFKVGAVQASGTITFASTGPANGETMTICGETYTAVTSGAGAKEFNISATPATVAANLAAAINAANGDLNGIVSATSALGVVTVTCAVPGLIGNGLVMANVDLANTTVVTFANGSDGTAYDLTLG